MSKHLRRDRVVLHCYITIAAFTGMRPTELRNLNWGDIVGCRACMDQPVGERDIRIGARGEEARTFVPLKAALPSFDFLWELWVKQMGSEPDDQDPVVVTINGKRLSSVKKSLGELLQACGLATDH